MPHDRGRQKRDEWTGSVVESTFFERPPNPVARDLLGCLLLVDGGPGAVGGVIVETEAYLGREDPGSHAATSSITPRNSMMYAPGSTVYVYLAYGCHHMLNLVCHVKHEAGAVLIRALEPTIGVAEMRLRRGDQVGLRDLCSGPGRLCTALGVSLADNGTRLGNGRITVYHGQRVPPGEVAVTRRVGLTAGYELEYRYYLRDNAFVSRGRPGPSRRHLRAQPEEGPD